MTCPVCRSTVARVLRLGHARRVGVRVNERWRFVLCPLFIHIMCHFVLSKDYLSRRVRQYPALVELLSSACMLVVAFRFSNYFRPYVTFR